MILGPSYKFPNAVRALNNMKNATRKEVIRFEDIVPQASKELKDKMVYMQQPEFWADKHNNKMFELGKEIGDVVANGGNKIKEYFYRQTMKNMTFKAVLNHIINH